MGPGQAGGALLPWLLALTQGKSALQCAPEAGGGPRWSWDSGEGRPVQPGSGGGVRSASKWTRDPDCLEPLGLTRTHTPIRINSSFSPSSTHESLLSKRFGFRCSHTRKFGAFVGGWPRGPPVQPSNFPELWQVLSSLESGIRDAERGCSLQRWKVALQETSMCVFTPQCPLFLFQEGALLFLSIGGRKSPLKY